MENFLIYKSSAGSGKTTALTGEFLKLILAERNPSRFKKVLAITFTNKATNEMKERLTAELRSAADCSPEAVPFLTERTMRAVGIDLAEVQKRARSAFVQILFDYGDLAVSTIDKFNHRLIRAFSRELNLRSDFEVHLDTKGLFRETVLRLTERAGTDPRITAHLSAYITDRLDDENRVNVVGELEKLEPLVMSEEAEVPLKALSDFDEEGFSEAAERLKSLRSDFEKTLKKLGSEATDLIAEIGAEAADFNRKSTGWHPKFSYFAAGDFSAPKKLGVSDTLRKIADQPMAHKDAEAGLKAAIEARDEALRSAALSIVDHMDRNSGTYLIAKEVLRSIHLLAVLNALRDTMGEIIRERNILPIAFFNRTISEELRKEPVAFIYENIGNRYENILIDEFQDTSELQWINLLPLVHESVGRGALSLVVGDAKQSIYRWRGGKAEQLISLPEIQDPRGITDPAAQVRLREAGKVIRLDTNYRSCGRIISFNNALIAQLKTELTEEGSRYREAYTDAEQIIPEHRRGCGYVEVNYLGKKPEKEDRYTPLLEQIESTVKQGYRHSDICLLVRTKKEGTLITSFLAEHGMTVSTADSRSIDADVRVNLIISLMRCRSNPDHNPAKAGALRALCVLKNIPFAPQKYTKGKAIDLDSFLKDNRLPLLRDDLFSQGAYQACENLIRAFIPEFKSTAPLSALLNYIFQKGGIRLPLDDFLRQWDESTDKPGAGTAEGSESVRMMTIHKCKGLQFPVVIIPTLDWAFKPNNNEPEWIDTSGNKEIGLPYAPLSVKEAFKEMGLSEAFEADRAAVRFDHLNMVYVALTRAEKALFVNYHTSDRGHIGTDFHLAVKALAAQIHTLLPGAQINGLSEDEDPKSPEAGSIRWGEIPPHEVTEDREKQATAPIAEPLEISTTPWHERFPFAFDPESIGENISRRSGILFHRLAAETTDLAEAEKWLDNSSTSGELSAEEHESLKSSARQLYTDEKYAALISSGKRFAERDLVWKGEVLRPDLVFELGDKVVVIDFKTGVKKETHLTQIRQYRDALASASGKPVESYLLYTDQMEWAEASAETAAGDASGQTRMF